MRPTQPVFYLTHGGGPCFFMEWRHGPSDTWDGLAAWLRALPEALPEPPQALLVVTAHWEQPVATVTTSEAPPLLYDYSGFPPHTYELTWPAPGDPALAARVGQLLEAAGLPHGTDPRRGFDHGVFVPMKVAWPEAEVPTVALSLVAGLDPGLHLEIGRALQPLRDEGVVIIGSGSSFHNLGLFGPRGKQPAEVFDAWLTETLTADPEARAARLVDWEQAPAARAAHPREEHLIPLLVAAGAAGTSAARATFHERIAGMRMSCVQFG